MGVKYGRWYSPGAVQRSLGLQEARAEALDATLEPLSVGLRGLLSGGTEPAAPSPPSFVPGDPTFEAGGAIPSPAEQFDIRRNIGGFQGVPDREEALRTLTGGLTPEVEDIGLERAPTVSGAVGTGLQGLQAAQERFADPLAAGALQVVQSPFGQAVPGGPELRGIQKAAERVGVEDFVPGVEEKSFQQIREEGGFVNPIDALGSDEERDKAQRVLEEAGLPTALAFQVVTDPLNFVPVVGFTKADDFLRLLKTGRKALRNPRFRQAVRAINAEAGGGRLGREGAEEFGRMAGRTPEEGVLGQVAEEGAQAIPPRPQWEQARDKLTASFGRLRESFKELDVTRGVERKKRVAESLRRLRGIEGPPEQRIQAARGAFKGEFPTLDVEAVSLTEDEANALLRRVVDHGLETGNAFDVQNAYDALIKLTNGNIPAPHEINILENIFGADFADAIRQARKGGPLGKAWSNLLEAAVFPKTLLSSFDVSYPFRQGIMVSARHLKEFGGNIPGMVKAFASEDTARTIQRSIIDDATEVPVVVNGKTVRVGFGEIADNSRLIRPLEGGAITQREEAFLSKVATRLPGIKQSARAFTVYGNKLRADIMRYWLDKWQRTGVEITPARIQGLSNLLNRLTGRGTLGSGPAARRVTEVLQATWWAPQYRLAAPQAFGHLFHSDPALRRIAAENLVAFVAGGTGILSAVKLSGLGDVTLDPRSSDFGKIRIGNQRVNFWGSSQLVARSIAQLIAGEGAGTFGPYPIERKGVLARYFRSGLAPEWSALWDAFAGQNYLGQQLGWSELLQREGDITQGEAFNRLVPLAFQEIADSAREEGIAGGLIGSSALLGVGIDAFSRPTEELAREFERVKGRPFNPETDFIVSEQEEELRPLLEEVRRSGLERQTPGSVRAEETKEAQIQIEQQLRLPDLAQQFNEGNVSVGDALIKAYSDFQAQMAGAHLRARVGVDDREPETEAGRALQELRDNAPQNFLDLETGEVDWGAWQSRSEEIKEQIRRADPDLAEALESSLRAEDEEFAQVEPQIKKAFDLRREFFDKPRYAELDTEQSEEIDELHAAVSQARARLARQGIDTRQIDSQELYQVVAAQQGKSEQFGFVAFLLRPGSASRENFLNPERQEFLVEHQQELAPFFPGLYRDRDIQAQLEEDVFEAVIR